MSTCSKESRNITTEQQNKRAERKKAEVRRAILGSCMRFNNPAIPLLNIYPKELKSGS